MIPEWFLYIGGISAILVVLALFIGITIALKIVRAKLQQSQPQPEKKEEITTKVPPPLTEEEQKLIRETQQFREIQTALEKEISPLGTPEKYWEAFKTIRSKRIQLDLLEAQLDALEAKKRAEKKLAEREKALMKRLAEAEAEKTSSS